MNSHLKIVSTEIEEPMPEHLELISALLVKLGYMLGDFNQILDRENLAIRHRDTDSLLIETKAKISLLKSIETSSAELTELMIGHGYQDSHAGINRDLMASKLGNIWEEFCQKLESSQSKNTVNIRAIELSRITTERIIDMLRGTSKSVYGRAGKMHSDNEVRNSLAEA